MGQGTAPDGSELNYSTLLSYHQTHYEENIKGKHLKCVTIQLWYNLKTWMFKKKKLYELFYYKPLRGFCEFSAPWTVPLSGSGFK